MADTPEPDARAQTFEKDVLQDRVQSHALAYELVGLQRVVSSIRLYGIGHDRAREQSEDLLTRIQPMLGELKNLHLLVTDGAMLFGETTVIEEGDRGGIVDELFRDGIRVLSLQDGIDVPEFLELLSILGTNFHLPQHQEDTLQGLLWAADLPHVSYDAVQGIEEAVEDSADAGRGEKVDFDRACNALLASPGGGPDGSDRQEISQLLGRLLTREERDQQPTGPDLPDWTPAVEDGAEGTGGADMGHAASEQTEGEKGLQDAPEWLDDLGGGRIETAEDPGEEAGTENAPSPADHAMAEDGEKRDGAGTGSGAAGKATQTASSLDTVDFVEGRADKLDVPPDELLQLWEEAETDALPTLLDRILSVLIHTALFEEPGAELGSAAPLVESCMVEASRHGLTSRYRTTVEMLAGIVDAEEGLLGDETAKELLQHLMQMSTVLEFASQVDPDDATAARDIQRVIQLGGDRMVNAIVDRIPDIESPEFQRFLVQRVVSALQGDPTMLTEGLVRMDGPRMRIRLEALARMDNYAARDQLTSLLEHAEPEVRITAIELIPSGHLRAVWKRLAQRLAGDPDRAVRCAIIRRMEADRLPVLAPLLRRMVTAESFHRRDPDEKQLALAALGRSGGEEGVATLVELLAGKASLVQPRLAETRRLAAQALGEVGHPTARAALLRASRSWDRGLRRAAAEALEISGGRRR